MGKSKNRRDEPKDDGDFLFLGMPQQVKDLWAKAKQAKRKKDRRDWADRNLRDRNED